MGFHTAFALSVPLVLAAATLSCGNSDEPRAAVGIDAPGGPQRLVGLTDSGNLVELGTSGGAKQQPLWTRGADGSSVFFFDVLTSDGTTVVSVDAGDCGRLHVIEPDGLGSKDLGVRGQDMALSANGRTLAYHEPAQTPDEPDGCGPGRLKLLDLDSGEQETIDYAAPPSASELSAITISSAADQIAFEVGDENGPSDLLFGEKVDGRWSIRSVRSPVAGEMWSSPQFRDDGILVVAECCDQSLGRDRSKDAPLRVLLIDPSGKREVLRELPEIPSTGDFDASGQYLVYTTIDGVTKQLPVAGGEPTEVARGLTRVAW